LFVGAEFDLHIRELYLRLGRAYELSGKHDQALAIYDELKRLGPKQS
jgi:tetratricopeptide (TPR) repeat protein